ncbi:hypothetical protein FQN49_000430 [Arthroderma sp. PD_2]|nr:hypothetical protein FQN49_000430 [Arthroderma sp. PD_2]
MQARILGEEIPDAQPDITNRIPYVVTFKKDISEAVVTRNHEQVYWFSVARIPQVFESGSISRFSKEGSRVFAEENVGFPLMPSARVTFGYLRSTKIIYYLLALEEAFFEHFGPMTGRFACLDAVHKITPNMALLKYQETRRPGDRRVRAIITVKASSFVTKYNAVILCIFSHYFLLSSRDVLIDWASDTYIGEERLDYLPLPQRSLQGTMPSNPEHGMGKHERMLKRALVALPFLGLLVLQWVLLKDQLFNLPYHHTGISWPMPIPVADFGVIYSIILIESARQTDRCSTLRNSIAAHRRKDMRPTDLSYTRSILPLMFLAYYMPYHLTTWNIAFGTNLGALWIFQMFPLWVSLGQLLAKLAILPSTIEDGRHYGAKRDMGTIRLTVAMAAVWSTISWFACIILALFFADPIVFSFRGCLESLSENRGQGSWPYDQSGLPYNYLFTVGYSFLWIFYLYWDLKKAGMIAHNWLTLLSVFFLGGLCIGPGAAIALAWLYRENILATQRHNEALI